MPSVAQRPDGATAISRSRDASPMPSFRRALLSVGGRGLLVVAGTAGLVSGTYVVLAEQDGTATTALIAASVALLFFGVFGHRIQSVRHGETEVRLLLEGAKDAAARGDEDTHDALVQAAVEVAQASVGLAPDVRVSDEGLLHGVAVVNALNAMEELKGKIEQTGRPVEAIATVDGHRIGIEPRRKMKKIDRVERRLIDHRRRTGSLPIDALLIVPRLAADDPRLGQAADRLQSTLGIPVTAVGWHAEDGSGPEPLQRAVQRLLRASSEPTGS